MLGAGALIGSLIFPEKIGKPLKQGLGNLWDDITGVSAAEAAADAQREGFDRAEDFLTSAQEQSQSQLEQSQQQFQELIGTIQGQMEQYLSPYSEAGEGALSQMQALAGAQGPEAQQAAIQGISDSPLLQAQIRQGEDALLQSAAATGGVRGGNTPQMLNQAIQQQYAQLGGISGMGANAAGQLASGALQSTGQEAGLVSRFGQMKSALPMQTAGQLAGLATGRGDVNASQALSAYQLQKDFLTDLAGMGVNIAGLLV
jgi:hypothetical protein